MSAWKEYKAKLGNTRPWDMLNPKTEYVDANISTERYGVCLECPSLLSLTKQCKECGCFMNMKVRLKNAKCPLGKW